jgi:hypothetical protein
MIAGVSEILGNNYNMVGIEMLTVVWEGLSIGRLHYNDNINIIGTGSGYVDWIEVRDYILLEHDSV